MESRPKNKRADRPFFTEAPFPPLEKIDDRQLSIFRPKIAKAAGSKAGILTFGSSSSPAFPPSRQWPSWGFVADYSSGGCVRLQRTSLAFKPARLKL